MWEGRRGRWEGRRRRGREEEAGGGGREEEEVGGKEKEEGGEEEEEEGKCGILGIVITTQPWFHLGPLLPWRQPSRYTLCTLCDQKSI